MNTKKLNFLVLFSFLFISLIFYGCSKSSDTVGPTNEDHPDLNMKVGSIYTYTVDSINVGGSSIRLNNKITSTVLAKNTLLNQSNVYIIQDIEIDGGQIIKIDTTSYKYDRFAGKGYIYGCSLLLNPKLTPKWNLLIDFSAYDNKTWIIDNINVVLTLPEGSTSIKGLLKGKIVGETTIQTTGNPSDEVRCYRIELNADLFGSFVIASMPCELSTTITLDYYIGYSSSLYPGNPPGVVRITNRPFLVNTDPDVGKFLFTGRDRILESFTIPD